MSRKPFGIITDRGSFVNRDILAGFEVSTKASATVESKQIQDDQPVRGIQGLIEPPYPVDSLSKLLEMNTYHYRACRTKSRESAGLGWDITPVDAAISAGAITPEQEAEKDRIKAFFDDMEEPITSMLEKVLMDYEALGFAAMEVLVDEVDGQVGDLRHIPARYLKRHRDRERYCEMRGVERVWFKDISVEGTIDLRSGEWLDRADPYAIRDDAAHSLNRGLLPETEGYSRPPTQPPTSAEIDGGVETGNPLIWFTNYTSSSDYYGMPDVVPATRAIMGDLSRSQYNISFFDNYGIPAYAVFVTGNFDPGEPVNDAGEPDEFGKTPLERAVEDSFSQLADKPYSTISFFIPSTDTEEGQVNVSIQKLGHDVTDAAFRMYRMDNRDETLSSHGVPAERAGIHIEGALGGNFAREATEIYKRSILEQRQEMIQHQINKWIVRGALGSIFWKWELKEIDTRDEQGEHDRDIQRVQNGVMSPNEFRMKWDMEKIDDPAMDMHYIGGLPIDADEGEIPPALGKGPQPSVEGAPPGRGMRVVPTASRTPDQGRTAPVAQRAR